MARFSIIRLAAIVIAVALSVALLAFADGAPRDVRHEQLPQTLLSLTFVALMIVLTLASLSNRLQLGLQMMAIYFTIYLILPGFHHLSTNVFPFYDMHYVASIRLRATLIVVFFVAAVLASYTYFLAGNGAASPRVRPRGTLLVRPNILLATFLLLIAIVSAAGFLQARGISGAFSVRGDGVGAIDGADQNKALAGIFASLPRAVTFISFLYALVLLRFGSRRIVGITFVALNVPVFLVTNWPPSLARFVLFGYILMGMTLLADMRAIRARAGMAAGFVFGALGLMPVVNALTRGGSRLADINYGGLLDRYFVSGDFDGLQSINNAVIYNQMHGTAGGRQLLSALLFFVPRAVWPGKSEPTGSITAEAAGYTFLNISQPLPSEFYVDFGMAGVVLGGLAVGYLLCRIDRWVDANWDGGPAARLVGGLIVAYSIIIYRGSLLGVIATVTVLIVGGSLIVRYGLRRAARRHLPDPKVTHFPFPLPAPRIG